MYDEPRTASDLINKELSANRISGPFDKKPFNKFHVSPLKLQPKKEQGKFRLIHNLSAPYDEQSINFHISEADSTVHYASIQDAISVIQKIGQHCFMAKSDIKSAFRLIPVSPNDYPRLGFTYKNMYYYDKCLAQGCASSCQIFECFSTALEWILRNKFSVKHCIHVLDDFMFLGASFEECKKYLESWEHVCNMLNVPLAVNKTIGPAQEIVFLGIQLSSREMTARLPQEKISLYTNKLSDLMRSRTVKLKEMQSVIGCLQFATSIILPGKAFTRRLIDTTIGVKKPFHYVTVNVEARADIRMWYLFFKYHNGKTLFLSTTKHSSLSLNLFHGCK